MDELRAVLATQSELSYQRHLKTDSDSEVLLNIFADEIHRAHKARQQQPGTAERRSFSLLLQEKPTSKERDLVFEAVRETMKQLKGSYSIISLISQVRGLPGLPVSH